ncbi:carotenoid biosynthesis protein [Candidatus Hydrogenedentota bacterium]
MAYSRLTLIMRDFPSYYIFIGVFAGIHIALKNLPEPRPAFALTAVFPLAVLVIDRIRWYRRRNPDEDYSRYAMRLSAVMISALAIILFLPRRPLEFDTLRKIGEISGLAGSALFIFHARLLHGKAGVAKFFGVGLLYGMIIENGGIWMGFFSEEGYMVYIPFLPAPLCNVLGWSIVYYMFNHFIDDSSISRKPLAAALVASVAMVAVDLQLDPIATRIGAWVWHDDLPELFLGVPLINFVAWFSAVFPFALFHFSLENKGDLYSSSRNRKLLVRIPVALVAALGIVLGLTIIFEGFASSTMNIFAGNLERLGGFFR